MEKIEMSEIIKTAREAEAKSIFILVEDLVNEGKTPEEIKEALKTYIEGK